MVAALALEGISCAAGRAVSPAPAAAAEPLPAWQAPLRPDHPLAGRIVDARRGVFVSEEALLARLARAEFVLLGETHDNPDHHRLQARVIQALVARGRRPAVALEMLSADVAAPLATALAEPGVGAERLREAVGWDARGWPDFALYAPVFETALAAGLPLVAADAGAELLRAAEADPDAPLPAASATRLALAGPAPDAVRRAHELEIRDAHCGHASEGRLAGMARVQWLRDAHLAAALVEAGHLPGARGAVLVAGSGHVRRDRGVPLHLERLAPGADVAVLAFLEIPADLAAGASAGGVAALAPGGSGTVHAVWLTPATDDRDPCERFGESLRSMRERASPDAP